MQVDANMPAYYNQIKCMVCSKTFSTRWDLGTHFKLAHYVKNEDEEDASKEEPEPTLLENRFIGEIFDLQQDLPSIGEESVSVPVPSEWVPEFTVFDGASTLVFKEELEAKQINNPWIFAAQTDKDE